MAKSPRAFGLGPLETIVNVGWNAGFFVCITVTATYVHGASGSRSASVALTDLGRKAGGHILGQHKFEFSEGGERGMQFLALLSFLRDPKNDQATFKIALAGSINVTDGGPPPTTAPFCGSSSATVSAGPLYATRVPPHDPPLPQDEFRGWNFWQDITQTYKTPAGTSSTTYTSGPIMGLRYPDDLGTGSYTHSGSDLEIWYQDGSGNYINTHEPCQVEGPLPGGGSPVTHVEGFDLIRAEVVPRAGYKALPVTDWTRNGPVIAAQTDKAFGRMQFQSEVPRPFKGVTADHFPKYEDLPSGSYDYTTGFLRFDAMPMIAPPQPYTTYAAWPFLPPIAQYTIRASTKTATYRPPTEPIPGTGERQEKLFPAGVRPPVDQVMESA